MPPKKSTSSSAANSGAEISATRSAATSRAATRASRAANLDPSARPALTEEELQALGPEERAARLADDDPRTSVSFADDAGGDAEVPAILASILEPGVGFGDVADEQPDWLRKLFPDGAWGFPVCDAKDGHLSGQLDAVHQELQRQAKACTGELRTKYDMYAAEWPVLRQSVLYSRLLATALAQVQDRTDDDDAAATIGELQLIIKGWMRDLLGRATVLMVASDHSEAGAQKIAAKLKAKRQGYLPELLDDIQDLGPAPQSSPPKPKSALRPAKFEGPSSAGAFNTYSNKPPKNLSSTRAGRRPQSPTKMQSQPKSATSGPAHAAGSEGD